MNKEIGLYMEKELQENLESQDLDGVPGLSGGGDGNLTEEETKQRINFYGWFISFPDLIKIIKDNASNIANLYKNRDKLFDSTKILDKLQERKEFILEDNKVLVEIIKKFLKKKNPNLDIDEYKLNNKINEIIETLRTEF